MEPIEVAVGQVAGRFQLPLQYQQGRLRIGIDLPVKCCPSLIGSEQWIEKWYACMAVPSACLLCKTLKGASLLIVQVSSLGLSATKGNILNACRIKMYLMCQKNAAF